MAASETCGPGALETWPQQTNSISDFWRAVLCMLYWLGLSSGKTKVPAQEVTIILTSHGASSLWISVAGAPCEQVMNSDVRECEILITPNHSSDGELSNPFKPRYSDSLWPTKFSLDPPSYFPSWSSNVNNIPITTVVPFSQLPRIMS